MFKNLLHKSCNVSSGNTHKKIHSSLSFFKPVDFSDDAGEGTAAILPHNKYKALKTLSHRQSHEVGITIIFTLWMTWLRPRGVK